MFDFFDEMKKKGKPVESIALFYEDTIFGADSSTVQRKLAKEKGIKIVADIKYRSNSPSLTAEVQQLKAANAQVLMPSSYTTDAILLMLGIALVPEGRRLFPRLAVRDNLRLGSYLHRRKSDREAPLETVFKLFPRLAERLDQRAETLSGGEQQMLAIGRALMTRPRLLMGAPITLLLILWVILGNNLIGPG